MVSTVSESAIKNPDFVSEKQQDVRAAEAVRRVQQRRRHDAPAAPGQRALRDPHRPPRGEVVGQHRGRHHDAQPKQPRLPRHDDQPGTDDGFIHSVVKFVV